MCCSLYTMGRKRRRSAAAAVSASDEGQAARFFSSHRASQPQDDPEETGVEVTHIIPFDDVVCWVDSQSGSLLCAHAMAVATGAWQTPLWTAFLPGAATCVAGAALCSTACKTSAPMHQKTPARVLLLAMARGMLLAVDPDTGSTVGSGVGMQPSSNTQAPATSPSMEQVSNEVVCMTPLAMEGAVSSFTPPAALVADRRGGVALAWAQCCVDSSGGDTAANVQVCTMELRMPSEETASPVTCAGGMASLCGGAMHTAVLQATAHGTVQAVHCRVHTAPWANSDTSSCGPVCAESSSLAVLPARVTGVVCLVPSLGQAAAEGGVQGTLPAVLHGTSVWGITDRTGGVAVVAVVADQHAASPPPPKLLFLARGSITQGGDARDQHAPSEPEHKTALCGVLTCIALGQAAFSCESACDSDSVSLSWERQMAAGDTAGKVTLTTVNVRAVCSTSDAEGATLRGVTAQLDSGRQMAVSHEWVIALEAAPGGGLWAGSLGGAGCSPTLWETGNAASAVDAGAAASGCRQP